MNKKLLLSLSLAALLASCSSDENVQEQNEGNEIKFVTAVKPPVKSIATGSSFREFNVTALKGTLKYLDNLKVTSSDGSTWGFDGGAKYYWPNDGGSLNFYAYAPTTLSMTINNTTKQLSSYTPDATVANQADILTAVKTAATSGGGDVSLNFTHALAKIDIQALNISTQGYTIEVKGVKLGGIKTSADMTLADDGTVSWGAGSNTSKFFINGTSKVDVTSNSTAHNLMFDASNQNSFLMIPQQLTAWNPEMSPYDGGAYISVYCHIKCNGVDFYPNDVTTESTDGYYKWLAVPIDTEWEAGKAYLYTLRFFDEGSGNGIGGAGVPDPEDGGGGSGPGITYSPITFTVSISEWTDVTPESININYPN